MAERITASSIEKTFARLKQVLDESNCELVVEEVPNYLRVMHGSLMGISPVSAKKVVAFYLSSEGSGTKISSVSKISAGWKNLALYGSIVTGVLIGILLWIASDMMGYVESARPGFWAWVAQMYVPYDPWMAVFIGGVIQALAVVLVVTIVIEIVVVVYVYQRKNVFSHQILETVCIRVDV